MIQRFTMRCEFCGVFHKFTVTATGDKISVDVENTSAVAFEIPTRDEDVQNMNNSATKGAPDAERENP